MSYTARCQTNFGSNSEKPVLGGFEPTQIRGQLYSISANGGRRPAQMQQGARGDGTQ